MHLLSSKYFHFKIYFDIRNNSNIGTHVGKIKVLPQYFIDSENLPPWVFYLLVFF